MENKKIDSGLMSFVCKEECGDICRDRGNVWTWIVEFNQCANNPTELQIENSIKMAAHVMKSEYLKWLKREEDAREDIEHIDKADNVSI